MLRCGAVVGAVVGVALGMAWVTGAGASAVAYRPLALTAAGSSRAPSPGTQLWVKRYNGPGNSVDQARSVAVSPSGTTVFVTGNSYGAGSPGVSGYATVAYNAATGGQLWVKRYDGPGNSGGEADSVAVSPSGKTVFVTGFSLGTAASGYADFATVAYSAATGARLWVRLYNGSGNFNDKAYSIAVSPSGQTVFVTGQTYTKNSGSPYYATIAYNAATGARSWVRIYHGSGNEGFTTEGAASVAVSPTGNTVFVTGQGATSDNPDYATVAYNATTGAQLWVRLYSYPGSSLCTANAVAVSPSGKTIFVTGYYEAASSAGYATVAYSTTTGARLWVKRYSPRGGSDDAYSVTVSPTGKTVFVTGGAYAAPSKSSEGGEAYATIAYNAATGAQLWIKRYNPGGTNDAYSAAVSLTGKKIYITGANGPHYATIAYNAATGAQLWLKHYDGGTLNPTLGGAALAVAVSRTTGTVFVTGYIIAKPRSSYDYVTIAYKG